MKCPYHKTENTPTIYSWCECNGNIPSPWHDARDALPDGYGHPVLAYCQFSEDDQYELDIVFFELTDKWISTKLGCEVDVKYWMTLPHPPEVKDNERND